MARRPQSDWEIAHNKRALKGVTMRELTRRRKRRRLKQLLRLAVLVGG